MTVRRIMIAGNWKMNLSIAESKNLIDEIVNGIRGFNKVDVLVAPPFTNLAAVYKAIGKSGIFLAAQDMHWEAEGAYTGEISGRMLIEAGCSHVILGHSERRSLFHETDKNVNLKVGAAIMAGLIPIVCMGETLAEREDGRTFDVIQGQLKGSLKNLLDENTMPSPIILAYEPVWAIGTGKTATPDQAQEVHEYIRGWIREKFDAEISERIRILYGGSVKPDNAKDLMSKPDIDGALVGGASLKPDSFLSIIRYR
ncbi:MAG: triose-phosphate isomerase [Deltaproteobacteria bacterium]|nr:triose-phosphate isomerase [Deltaproteobacteria bacterium]